MEYIAWLRYWDGKRYSLWQRWASHWNRTCLEDRLRTFIDHRQETADKHIYSGVILPAGESPNRRKV